jgi:putative hydrolase of the HAD superfamily
MCKNVIFDIGNVLLKFSPYEFVKNKIKDIEKVEEIYKNIFKSKEWLMLDSGTISNEKALEIFINRGKNTKEDIINIFNNWTDCLYPINKNIEIVEKLKKSGINVYYLSNFHLKAFENIINEYKVFSLFDGGVVSAREKVIKPDERIYKILMKRYNIKPSDSVFIDDMDYNIGAAKKLNFKTILYNDKVILKEELEKNINLGGIL